MQRTGLMREPRRIRKRAVGGETLNRSGPFAVGRLHLPDIGHEIPTLKFQELDQKSIPPGRGPAASAPEPPVQPDVVAIPF